MFSKCLDSLLKQVSLSCRMDKLHMALTEVCYAINYCPTMTIWEHTFAPREYLANHLETRFAKALVGMVMFDSESGDIAKPTELLSSVRAYMSVLQGIENVGEYPLGPLSNLEFLAVCHKMG